MKLITSDYIKRWNTLSYAVVDLEGTGAQHREQEGIVDIAGVLVENGAVTHQYFNFLLNPQISIPSFISRIHGITNQDVQGRPTLSEVKNDILRFLEGRILVAHNAPVERRVLRFKLPECEPFIILDTLKMSRAAYPQEKKHGLDEVIIRLHLDLRLPADVNVRRHSALYDALATAHAFAILAERLVGIEGTLQDILAYSVRD